MHKNLFIELFYPSGFSTQQSSVCTFGNYSSVDCSALALEADKQHGNASGLFTLSSLATASTLFRCLILTGAPTSAIPPACVVSTFEVGVPSFGATLVYMQMSGLAQEAFENCLETGIGGRVQDLTTTIAFAQYVRILNLTNIRSSFNSDAVVASGVGRPTDLALLESLLREALPNALAFIDNGLFYDLGTNNQNVDYDLERRTITVPIRDCE